MTGLRSTSVDMSRLRTRRLQKGTASKANEGGDCACDLAWCYVCGIRKCRMIKSSKWLDDALNTEYKREFPPKGVPFEKRQPGAVPLESMPFYGTTTNRADFTPKSGRARSTRPADRPMPANRLDDRTAYNADFTPKHADLAQPAKAPEPGWTAPFVGASTYRSEYVPKTVRPWTARPAEGLLDVPFDGTTEYRDHYISKPHPPRSARSAAPLLPSSHVPTITTYGHDYVPKLFEGREKPVCCDDPAHRGECKPAPRRPGEGYGSVGGALGYGSPRGSGGGSGGGRPRAPCCERPWSSCSSCAEEGHSRRRPPSVGRLR